ncbi:MAG: TraR/DksA C4-type zinc finger protein [Caldilineaceae bacterium]|nr:TraR/DksA C4-type zinc finger protein [Caldilineaceae bacterium]
MPREEFIGKEKEFLTQEREHILTELDHLREFLQAEVDVEPDEGDAEIFEREKNAALIAVLDGKLKDIDAALRSIEKGRYGICERCDKPIEIGRLEVKPDATLCLSCQQEVERLARRNRPSRQINW